MTGRQPASRGNASARRLSPGQILARVVGLDAGLFVGLAILGGVFALIIR